MKKFVPFNQIKSAEVIVVDGLHPNNLVLSHWKGANIHKDIAADTSGEIVLNALEKNYPDIEIPLISATHFDIDGFVGVFALFYPDIAMSYKGVLAAMARIGDFREFNPNREADIHALKLCCWMNKLEKEKFYRPFGEKDEIEKCAEKFDYFLPMFEDVLRNPVQFKSLWQEEYELVYEGLKNLKSIEASDRHDSIGLIVKKAEEPIHYYALFSKTEGYDIVMSIYTNQRYELEYKYTTWIDLASRPNLPRIDLSPLVRSLNKLESSEYTWVADKITDTGPILRLEKDKISKADRYANPTDRELFKSSIEENLFKKKVILFLEMATKGIKARKNWTWKEMKVFQYHSNDIFPSITK